MTRYGLDENACWRAVLSRDSGARGRFVYGVLTTGVYCLPGCSSRAPRRENVRFFLTAQEAEAVGLRPCRRCRPDQSETPHAERIRRIRERLDRTEGERISLNDLAAEFNWTPSHLQRTFKAATGLSPRQYLAQLRAQRLKTSLKSGAPVTDAVYDAGYSSGSRMYESAPRTLGMRPTEYKSGGSGVVIRYGCAPCPVGWALVGRTDRGVCASFLGSSKAAVEQQLRDEFPQATLEEVPGASWTALQSWLSGPLDLEGTVFQRLVWSYLQTIPAGQTRSYSDVARALGHPGASRAVARACATNRIAVAIPCHRVIGSDGALRGYRWGLDRKRQLLGLEQAAAGR